MDQEEAKEEKVIEKPKKKKGKFLRKFIIFLVVVGIIAIALGFIFPGLIWVKDLGVTYTKADYQSFMNKLNILKDDAPTSGTADDYEYTYGELRDVEVEFTSEEITSFFNENRPSYYPLKNVQVKINDDGTIEASGTAYVDYFLNEVLGGKYSREQINKEIPALGILPSNVNFYLKFSGSVANNRSSVNINIVEVQGIAVPNNYVTSMEAKGTVETGLNNIMKDYNTKSGATFDRITVENSKIIFKGKVPSTLERTKK